MHIAVMGAGGMGGYLGAKLARGGHDVALIARGAHLEALRRRGLRISGAESLEVSGLQATDRPAEIGAVDTVLFCVKLYDTEAAAELIRPLLGQDTFVVTVQNGVESAARIAGVIGPERTLAGAAPSSAPILGVRLPDDVEARVLGLLDSSPANGKTSQLVDLERGRRLELEWLSGTVVRLGSEHGVSTPVHRTVYAALKPYARGTDRV